MPPGSGRRYAQVALLYSLPTAFFDQAVRDPVWQLYKETIKLMGPVSTMIECDDNIPPFAELEKELDHARALSHSALTESNREQSRGQYQCLI